MQAHNTHYQLPDSTNASVRKMGIMLCLFFAALLLVVALMLFYAQHIVQYIPFSAEKRFVRPYENLISRYFSDLSGDTEVTAYLQNLSNSLEESMLVSGDIDITVHYIEMDEINAFATLGGHIFLFSGLIDALPDENALAMVLAHEIAHISHRDPIASVSRGMAWQMLLGFALNDSSALEELLDVAGGSGIALFSRKQEQEADVAALQALNAHYGHIGGYRSFFELVQEAEQQAQDSDNPDSDSDNLFDKWLASHPAVEDRLTYLDDAVDGIGATPGANVPLPALIRELSRQSVESL